MNTEAIIAELDAEIGTLRRVRDLLEGRDGFAGYSKRRVSATSFDPSTFAAKSRKRTISAAGRARIAAAQKARWAKVKKAAKAAKAA